MESKAKALGHPIHPMLIVLPLGLLTSAVILDILFLVTGNEIFAEVAYINIALGVLGGVLAAIFGFADFAAIPVDTRARRVALQHGAGNLVVLILFSISWLVRQNAPNYEPDVLALGLGFLGFAVAGVTGWLGGELVHRLGVSIDPGANLNAPNALSDEAPAPHRYEPMPVTGKPDEMDEP